LTLEKGQAFFEILVSFNTGRNGNNNVIKTIKTFLLALFIVVGTQSINTAEAVKTLFVEINHAKHIPFKGDVIDVFVANANIADVKLNKSGVYVYGKKAGATSLYLVAADGKQTEMLLDVTQSLSQLNAVLKKVFPSEKIKTISSPNGILLVGSVTSSKVVKDAENIATQFIDKQSKVVNNLTLSTSTQVYLKVRIAEINRKVLTKIDPNWTLKANNNFTFGVLTGAGGKFRDSAVGDFMGGLGFSFKNSHNDFSAFLDVLDEEGLGTILAQPNLVALSGESASFLVGGEFPFPVPQGNNNVTIEFKKFGISLAFTPTVLGPDLINLRVSPEVSEIDDTRSTTFTLAGRNLVVPSLKTRKAETSVELTSGQSFAIAGLLSHNITNTVKQFPGLGSIPILGALFTSTKFERNETELVIIVTPYIVNPTKPQNLEVPTAGIQHASTLEMLFQKRLNKQSPARLQTAAGFHIG